MATRDELLTALAVRYRGSGRAEKSRILDEFASVTGHHRKHAMRLLRAGSSKQAPASRSERRVYDAAVREALIVLWEASDRICGKRLKAMIPTLLPAMERHGHLDLIPEIRLHCLADLDPVPLLTEIRSWQQALVAIANGTVALPVDTLPAPIPVADFLAGLRTAWQMGKDRPTAQPTPKPKHGRRRPEPLVTVTDDLQSWFEANPAQTESELLLRLQTSDPDRYPDALLRTVQRRLKIWRGEIASHLVFGIPNQTQVNYIILVFPSILFLLQCSFCEVVVFLVENYYLAIRKYHS